MGEDEEGFEEEGGRGKEDERVHQSAEECEDITMLLFFDPLRLCRERDRDTIAPDNPYKLARSFLIKFIELIRDLHRDNCSLST